MIGGKIIAVKISGSSLGKGNDERSVDTMPVKMNVIVEGKPKRRVIRLIIVTTRRMLYTATKGPCSDKLLPKISGKT